MMNNLKFTYVLLLAAILINFSGLFIPIMGPDGAIYASIAKTMALSNNYVDIFSMGRDWLDKPHFPFWVAAFFFEIFGINTWAYKLPAILFLMMGAYYTYRLARDLYNKETGLWAAIILLTAQHIILSNMDVRAEPYLTGLIIAAVFHFHKIISGKHWGHLLAGCVFAACAVMTKGVFALVPICGAIAGQLIMQGRWKQLFHFRWLAAAILILLFTIPELYCLYIQFDSHPEKTIFGRQGVSGIRFFFWDSQFGRFFNTGPIKGSGDKFFFFHTVLWAFLPWSILLYAAFIQWFRKNFRRPWRSEWYCFYGSLITFLLFSLSGFQLPHYLNIVFPFFAIVVAWYLFSLRSKNTFRIINGIQGGIILLLILLAAALLWFFKPPFSVFTIILLGIIVLAILFIPAATLLQKILYRTVLAAIFVNIFLNGIFYPSLLQYQASSKAAFWLNDNRPDLPVVIQPETELYSFPLEFYLKQPLHSVADFRQYPSKPFILYAPLDSMSTTGTGQLLKSFEYYPITKLTPRFINHKTRPEKTSGYGVFLIE